MTECSWILLRKRNVPNLYKKSKQTFYIR